MYSSKIIKCNVIVHHEIKTKYKANVKKKLFSKQVIINYFMLCIIT